MYNYLHKMHSTLSTLTRVAIVRERESTNNDALFSYNLSMLLIQDVDSTYVTKQLTIIIMVGFQAGK